MQLTRLKHGVDNSNYFIKLGKSKFIVKFYSKFGFKKVLEINKAVKHLVDEGILAYKNILSFPFLWPISINKYIEGGHLEYGSISANNVSEIMQQVAKINSSDVNFVSDKIIEKSYLIGLIDKCKEFEHIKLVEDCFNNIDFKYLEKLSVGLVHGDISHTNILFENNRLMGILDFDHLSKTYLLTELVRIIAFFGFDENDKLSANFIELIQKEYSKHRTLTKIDQNNLLNHLKVVIITMILETYFYVEVVKKVSTSVFLNSTYNHSYTRWYKKLDQILKSKELEFINNSF